MLPGTQPWQTPFTHTWPCAQPLVAVHCTPQLPVLVGLVHAWQAPFTQTVPSGQGRFGSHCCGQPVVPAAQTGWQTLLTQASDGSLQAPSVPAEFGQHTWPALPHWGRQVVLVHGWQSPLRHAWPPVHTAPLLQVGRQLEPVELQAVHWPPTQS